MMITGSYMHCSTGINGIIIDSLVVISDRGIPSGFNGDTSYFYLYGGSGLPAYTLMGISNTPQPKSYSPYRENAINELEHPVVITSYGNVLDGSKVVGPTGPYGPMAFANPPGPTGSWGVQGSPSNYVPCGVPSGIVMMKPPTK
jgi:hypothetical protein